jgi:hypothetical protein
MKRSFEDISFNITMVFAITCIILHTIAIIYKLFT